MDRKALLAGLIAAFGFSLGVYAAGAQGSLPGAPNAPANSIVVDTLADDNAVNGNCTLREAMTAANTNAIVDACPAGASGLDTITFSVSGTIVLSSTLNVLPAVSQDMAIIGPSGGITVSGNNAVQVMRVNSGAALSLANLTIANGFVSSLAGGGIFNSGDLNITNSTFISNTAVVGGGIANTGVMTVTNSTFTGNVATPGAGLYNAGTTTIINSTFSGNSPTGSGSAVSNSSALMRLTNDTIAGNGGGGVDIGVDLRISNTIIANNVGTNCIGAGLVDGGNNLEYGGISCPFLLHVDPKLGPLAANGGWTKTMALLPGSAAYNGVTFNPPNGCPPSDQRGYFRPQAALCDIGAFEVVTGTITSLPLIRR